MPIRPENKARYPKNWKEIRAQILERAGNKCEFCGVENHSLRYRVSEKDGLEIPTRVVLTIAHLSEEIEDCSPENLRALCQRCHNRLDAKMRAKHRSHTLFEKKNNGVLELKFEENG